MELIFTAQRRRKKLPAATNIKSICRNALIEILGGQICITSAIFLFWAFLPVLAHAQASGTDQPTVTITQIQSAPPSESAHIEKYYVDKPAPDSDYDTGNLHIIYDDGTEVVEKLPPKEKSMKMDIVLNQEGITDPRVAEDKRTIGWTETFDNPDGTSRIPLVLAIYQSGKTVLELQQETTIWFWTFIDGGKFVAAVWGANHGPELRRYELYDAKTGRMVSQASNDEKTFLLKPNAPEWAKQTEQKMHSP
jgi:hypothetical protein